MTLDGLVFGAGGMLATSLEREVARREEAHRWLFLTERQADIADGPCIASLLDEYRPCWAVNLAAYTDVDGAEREADRAHRVNAQAVESLARACEQRDVRLLQLSTDYVFDGSRREPWGEDDAPNPINEYGRSKAAGERAIADSGAAHLIVRTSWLFAEHGRNLVITARERLRRGETLRVVSDRRGRPTYAGDLAGWLLDLMALDARGIVHACNDGVATWLDLATRVRDLLGLDARVEPCRGEDWPAAAARPANSVLAIDRLATLLKRRPRPWHEALADMLGRIPDA